MSSCPSARGHGGVSPMFWEQPMKALMVLSLGASLAGSCCAQEILDQLENHLHLQSRDGWFRTELSGLLDLEGYYVYQRAPGVSDANHSFINPRASFFIDTSLGTHFYSFVQARVDRGFDPGTHDMEARLDEYLLRWRDRKSQR